MINETPSTPSFYDQRLAPLGVTEANNTIEIWDAEAEFPRPSSYTTPIFSEDKDGNINILYYSINGELIQYFQGGTGKTSHINGKYRNYIVKRLKEPKGDIKYLMPSGHGTHPWFHPSLVAKYKAKTRIETLYLTEGVFKGWAGCENGVDVVALSSITHYSDKEKKLHGDIVDLIETCEVQNIVVLWDGDCLNISDTDLARREPLTRRPVGFYKAAKKVAELVAKITFKKTRHHPCVYFMHPKSASMTNKPKGLDDVLIEPELQNAKTNILSDLRSFTDGRWWGCCNITESAQEMYRMMGLHDIQVFFDRHRYKIKLNEFYFFSDKYKYNDTREELELLMPGWANSLRWIGDDFYDLQQVPGAVHERQKLVPIKIGTLKNLYGTDFLRYMKNAHHTAFVNIPNHFDYEEVLERYGKKYYNRYFPFRHVPVEGTFQKTMAFMKHIFGEVEVTNSLTGKKTTTLELGLDYVQQLLLHPTQILPVLILYSPENNTGKSTLGKWLREMFSDNAVFISNHDLQSEFNDTFADKLLAICEETLLERKKEAERIKALSTSTQIMVNPKGVAGFSIDFFCKFQFYSNNKRMIYVTKHDERFWILRVPVIKADNPNMLEDMKSEIPAFVNALKHRKMATTNDSRMWFHPSLIRTKWLEETVRVNEPQEASGLREEIKDMFLQNGNIKHIEMTMKAIQKEFFSATTKQTWITELLKDYLDVSLERTEKGEAVFRRGNYIKYELVESGGGGGAYSNYDIKAVTKPTRGRHYIFQREKFVDDAIDASFIEDEETAPSVSAMPHKVGEVQNLPDLKTVVYTPPSKLDAERNRRDALKATIRAMRQNNFPPKEIAKEEALLEEIEKNITYHEQQRQTDMPF